MQLLPPCSIKGQSRKECALHPNCTMTCKDIGEPLRVCAESCVVNGCECPNGTIVDEEKSECVPLSECPGMYIILLIIRMTIRYHSF